MMVPMLKMHPFLVEVLVVSIVNGASLDAGLRPIFYTFFRPTGP
jgi:hypothetical protein